MNNKNNNNKMFTSAKIPYLPPMMDVYNYAVEHGFAHSAKGGGQPFGEAGSGGGGTSKDAFGSSENFHGEWY